MKNKSLIGIFLLLFVFISCSKDDDFTDPKNLLGTSWKSLDAVESYGEEYYLLKFSSATRTEFWIKYCNEDELVKEFDGMYTIDGNAISILDEFERDYSGLIEDNTITLFVWGEMCEFFKQ